MTQSIEKACCFTGHRDLPKNEREQLRRDLDTVIENLYTLSGVDTFISGGALGFDTLAAEAVIEAKRRHPDIRLVFALPCTDHSKLWRESDASKFRVLSLYASEIFCMRESYTRGCMHERNRFMLQNSLYCVSYCRKNSGGTFYTVNEAKKMGRTLIEL